MIVDRSDAVVVKPPPRYPDYQYNRVHITPLNVRDQVLPDGVINQLQIPPPANQIAPPRTTPVIPVPNGGAPPTPRAGFPAWAKIGIVAVGVLFLIGGLRT